MRSRRQTAQRLLAVCIAALLLTGCSFGPTRPPPTLAAATQKPFVQVTRVDWSNTTDAVRRDYLTRALADYPGCPVTAMQIEGQIWNTYSAEGVPHPPPERLFTSTVTGAGCQRRT